MPRCVIIQPFDKGEFDKRYDDVFVPAVTAAGLEPYRVDRDPSSIIPIDTIEKNIRDADACLADISLENPNVWYEVGFAIASGKEVVLVCKEGSKFPFDVRHRAIVAYTTHSTRDFDELRNKITERLKALTKKAQLIEEISPVKATHGLTASETVALALIMENRLTPNSSLFPQSIANDMGRAGYTKLASALALEGLMSKRYIDLIEDTDFNGNQFELYRLTQSGVQWCMKNQHLFTLKNDPSIPRGNRRPTRQLPAPPPTANEEETDEEDEDIPF